MAASWQSWEGDPGCARLVPCPPVTPVTCGFYEPKLRALVPCICSERETSSPQKAQETAFPPIVRALGGSAKRKREPVPQLKAPSLRFPTDTTLLPPVSTTCRWPGKDPVWLSQTCTHHPSWGTRSSLVTSRWAAAAPGPPSPARCKRESDLPPVASGGFQPFAI